LTYAVRPVELRAIVVKFIVAAKTAEADYLYITGTDAWDVAQTESIDVSAGNGTYTSTKRWRTISNISCSDAADGTGTVWADGTLAVTQDIWGVIWDLGAASYRLNCILNVGDGSTSTYFTSTFNLLIVDNTWVTAASVDIISVKTAAVFTLGRLRNETYKTVRDVSAVCVYASESYAGDLIDGTGTIYLYGISFTDISGDAGKDCNVSLGSCNASSRVWHCTFSGKISLNAPNNGNFYDLKFISQTYGLRSPGSAGTFDRMTAVGCTYSSYFYNVNQVNARNLYGYGPLISSFAISRFNNYWNGYINAIVDAWTFTWLSTGNNHKVYRRYTIDIHIADKNGTNLAGATVLMENKDGSSTSVAETLHGFSTTTAADGTITQQIVSRGYYDEVGGNTIYEFSPHKITVSLAGYETLILDNITLDGPIVWHLELQPLDYPEDAWRHNV
jgi:hypothetical protein